MEQGTLTTTLNTFADKVSQSPRPLKLIKKATEDFNRRQVMDAFQHAFLMIGGVQRLALWANENPTEFFKLYGRLFPSPTIQFGDSSKPVFLFNVAPGALDQHPGFEPIDVVPREVVKDTDAP